MKGFSGGHFTIILFLSIFFATWSEARVRTGCKALKSSPELSFTLGSYYSGDLDANCASSIKRALDKGFTTVTLVPSRFLFQNKIMTGSAVSEKEIWRCLDIAWKSGLHIVYQPHVETDYFSHPNDPWPWRGYFDFSPGNDYSENMTDPFLRWVAKNKSEILSSKRLIRITMASELEKSTTKYGHAWKTISLGLRQELHQLGMGNRISLGYDPNWYPVPEVMNQKSCADFRAFIDSLDFVAPSLYGDWSHPWNAQGRPLGAVQVQNKLSEAIQRFIQLSQTCTVPDFQLKSYDIGEFGDGGNNMHAEEVDTATMKTPAAQEARRVIFENIISWAKIQQSTIPQNRAIINLWTGGVFDPVGVVPSAETIADEFITQQFKDYARWRCEN